MTPGELAKLHGRAMTTPAPWSEKDFTDLLGSPGVFLVPQPSTVGMNRGGNAPSSAAAEDLAAFALGRVSLDEAELLTIVVDPAHQRRGLGKVCLRAFETQARYLGAATGFLEVAVANQAAINLYISAGWTKVGARPAYYKTAKGRIDALLMSKPLDVT
ncbi:MAG: GNAT family N-acetyltransferase [Silicimonas sp.]|nr:GNAT family N-acetyltransferase [Silicimonas sp.]